MCRMVSIIMSSCFLNALRGNDYAITNWTYGKQYFVACIIGMLNRFQVHTYTVYTSIFYFAI